MAAKIRSHLNFISYLAANNLYVKTRVFYTTEKDTQVDKYILHFFPGYTHYRTVAMQKIFFLVCRKFSAHLSAN